MSPVLLLLPLIGCGPAKVEVGGDDSGTSPTTSVPTEEFALTGAVATVHPEFGSILVVDWTQNATADVHLEFSVDPGEWRSSPARTLTAGAHQEYVLGAPYGVDVTWRVVAVHRGVEHVGADTVTATGATPADLPVPEVTVAAAAEADWDGAPFLFTTLADEGFGSKWSIGIWDRQGRAVWWRRSDRNRTSIHARVARDGRSLYLDQNSFWSEFDGGEASTIEQTLLDGTVVHTFETPGLHHPFTDMPDGSVVYGQMLGYYADELLTQVGRDGVVTEIWGCGAWLDEIGERDYCGSNTVTWSEETERFLFSFYSFETIVEIDPAAGEATRWFGHVAGSWSFEPSDSTVWWQHGGILTPTGTLLTSTDLTSRGVETVVREYELDDATQTAREVWNMDVDAGIYGEQMGEATRLANGNTWHNFGLLPRVREGTPDGAVVWDLEWRGEAIGRSMPVVDLYAMAGERF